MEHRRDGSWTEAWDSTAWREEASLWVASELAKRGERLAATLTQLQVRPWSTLLTAPTSAGAVFFKAVVPALGHEPGLTQSLAEKWPGVIPPVLAVDPERGWMLLGNGGRRLREVEQPTYMRYWRRVLSQYAAMQLELSRCQEALSSLGVPGHQLTSLPDQYRAMLTDPCLMESTSGEGLTPSEHAALVSLQGRVEGLCEELAQWGIPETLQHDDFHDGNILVHDGRFVLADWGESFVAHPFFTLVVTLRSIAYQRGWPVDHPELQELRDGYLEAWCGFGGLEELRRAAALAQRLGAVARALSWHMVTAGLDRMRWKEYADSAAGWLREFLMREPPSR